MKKIRTRLLSLLLVLVTVLSLLPTSALAASSTGTGIKPTNNTNYWTTRLLHDGTPYSYKPPMAAGKMLYCMDRGYGYRWGTASFLNSYTYTSATGADADTVLKTALAQSGLGELDAQQLENFKWMMTYIVDYKGDIPGSLFMAAQTYVWDHQTFKGEGDGDIDGGGYANADTYETYLGYIDWMLAEKAKEDAAFQKQIEEYAAQGVIATVVEDDTAKWAVWAKSSVKGRQSFFNYYAPRKLSLEAQPGEPDIPPAGTGDITLKKVAAGTTRGLDEMCIRDRYEILAGHNRTEAWRLTGHSTIPAEVVEADDARAISIAVATNLLRRQDLTIIERGKAYRALLDENNRHGQRNATPSSTTFGDSRQKLDGDSNGETFGENRQRYNARKIVADFFGVTEYEIRKAIKLAALIPPLADILENSPRKLPIACAELDVYKRQVSTDGSIRASAAGGGCWVILQDS